MNSARKHELLTTRDGHEITTQELGSRLEAVIGFLLSSIDPGFLRDRLMRASANAPAESPPRRTALDAATWMVRQPREPFRKAGIELLEWLVAKGCAWAMYNLAIEKLLGVSCTPDLPGANQLLEKATELGGTDTVLNGLAYGALADSYGQGRGMPPDIKHAQQLYERAAEFGNPEAAFNAGLYYDPTTHSRGALVIDALKAAYFYELAAAAGLSQAKIKLGVLHATGAFAGADPQLGGRLLQEAARGTR
jgi:TPR repeat protein